MCNLHDVNLLGGHIAVTNFNISDLLDNDFRLLTDILYIMVSVLILSCGLLFIPTQNNKFRHVWRMLNCWWNISFQLHILICYDIAFIFALHLHFNEINSCRCTLFCVCLRKYNQLFNSTDLVLITINNFLMTHKSHVTCFVFWST